MSARFFYRWSHYSPSVIEKQVTKEVKSPLFLSQSNKHTIAAGVVSPEAISGADSEYAHLFGNGFDKSGVEDEKVVVLFDDDHVPIQWE